MKITKKIFRQSTIFVKDGDMIELLKELLEQPLWGFDKTYENLYSVSSGYLHYEDGIFYLSMNHFDKPIIESIEELNLLLNFPFKAKTIKSNVDVARVALYDLKNDVVGLVQIYGNFHLVTKLYDETFDSIFITHFGAIQQDFGVSRKSFPNLKLFPDNKNLNQMIDNPFEYQKFIEENFK